MFCYNPLSTIEIKSRKTLVSKQIIIILQCNSGIGLYISCHLCPEVGLVSFNILK